MSVKTMNVIATGYKEPKKISIKVNTNDKIKLFKEQLAKEIFDPEFQAVAIDDGELRIHGYKADPEKTIEYYAPFGTNWSLHIPQIVQYININVKTLTGKNISVRISNLDTVEDIKNQIKMKENFPNEEQRLIYNGRELTDDIKIGLLDIKEGGVLRLVLKLRGGAKILCMAFTDVFNESGRKCIYYDDEDKIPKGRKSCRGINIEITCHCISYPVIVQIGHGIFDLQLNELLCPLCRCKAESRVTVGFIDCSYRMRGIKMNGTEFTSTWSTAELIEGYVVFDPKECGTIDWLRLIIESTQCLSQLCEICNSCISGAVLERIICGHYYHRHCLESHGFTCSLCPS